MPRKTSSRYAFVMPKTVRRRSTYEQRTRQLTRGAKVLCQAVNDGPVFYRGPGRQPQSASGPARKSATGASSTSPPR